MKYPKLHDADWLNRMYWKEGLDTTDIARITGADSKYVSKMMNDLDTVKAPRQGSMEDRFWRLVFSKEPGECWEWKRSTDEAGYGLFFIDKKPKRAHRIAHEIEYDKNPGELNVNHHCDNPACINPNHLYVGTQADNMADALRRGRL